LKFGANVDEVDDRLESPLSVAARLNYCKVVRALYQLSNPDFKDVNGKTAQQHVCKKCKLCTAYLHYAVGNMWFYKTFWKYFPWLWFISALAFVCNFILELAFAKPEPPEDFSFTGGLLGFILGLQSISTYFEKQLH
jgi:hypothetical protein